MLSLPVRSCRCFGAVRDQRSLRARVGLRAAVAGAAVTTQGAAPRLDSQCSSLALHCSRLPPHCALVLSQATLTDVAARCVALLLRSCSQSPLLSSARMSAAATAAATAAPAVVAAASAAASSAAKAAAATVTAPAVAAVAAADSSLLQSVVDFFSLHHISSVSNDKISSFQFVQGQPRRTASAQLSDVTDREHRR